MSTGMHGVWSMFSMVNHMAPLCVEFNLTGRRLQCSRLRLHRTFMLRDPDHDMYTTLNTSVPPRDNHYGIGYGIAGFDESLWRWRDLGASYSLDNMLNALVQMGVTGLQPMDFEQNMRLSVAQLHGDEPPPTRHPFGVAADASGVDQCLVDLCHLCREATNRLAMAVTLWDQTDEEFSGTEFWEVFGDEDTELPQDDIYSQDLWRNVYAYGWGNLGYSDLEDYLDLPVNRVLNAMRRASASADQRIRPGLPFFWSGIFSDGQEVVELP